MVLVMVFGPYLGCGKTAFLAWGAVQASKQNPKPYIASNFKLDVADDVAPGEVLLLDEGLEQCYLSIDELWTLIDSRMSMAGANEWFNDFVLMSRKRGINIIGTSQMPNMIDKRFRNIADYGVLTTRIGKDHDPRAWIQPYIASPDFTAEDNIMLKRMKHFRVSEVMSHYDTSQTIERNPRILVCKLAEKAVRMKLYDPHGEIGADGQRELYHVIDAIRHEKYSTRQQMLVRKYLKCQADVAQLVLGELVRMGEI